MYKRGGLPVRTRFGRLTTAFSSAAINPAPLFTPARSSARRFVFFVLSRREESAPNGFDRRFCLGCESVATDVVAGSSAGNENTSYLGGSSFL